MVTNSFFANARIVDKILAIVENDIITLSDVKDYQERLKEDKLVDESFIELYNKEEIKTSQEYALNFLIDKKVISNQSGVSKENLKSRTQKEIQNIANYNRTDINGIRRKITSEGINFDDYQSFLSESMERKILFQRTIIPLVKISPTELDIELEKKGLPSGKEVKIYTLRQAFIPNSASISSANRSALFKKLKASSFGLDDFQKLEKDKSGIVVVENEYMPSDLIPEISKSLIGQKQNSMIGWIKSPLGYHLIKILDSRTEKTYTQDPRIQQVQQDLFKKKLNRTYKTWIKGAKAKVFIKKNV